MKDKLISRAIKLGYSKHSGFSSKELDEQPLISIYKQIEYFLIQKWLREKYNINLWVECVYHDGLNYFCETEIKIFDFFKSLDEYDEWDANHWIPNFESYEEALEKGLFKFLKLIK